MRADLSCQDKHLRVNATKSLQIPVSLAPIYLHRRHQRTRCGVLARTVPCGSRSAAAHRSGRRVAIRVRPPLPSRAASTASSRSRRGRGPVARAACSAPRDDFLGLRDRAGKNPGLIPNPQRAENLPSSCAFRPQQFAGNCVLFERRLIRAVRRALGGDHTSSGTAGYSFGADESGNLGIAIVVRHDLSLLAG